MSAMVDGWRGDDWFHNGAFRMPSLSYIAGQTSVRRRRIAGPGRLRRLRGVSAHRLGWRLREEVRHRQADLHEKLFEHPAYDSYWQQQALDKILAKRPLKVPTMHVVGQWDQEDIYGACASYWAMEGRDKRNNLNFLAIGPWRHSGVNYEGSSLGVLKFTATRRWSSAATSCSPSSTNT
jgi:predicted acyl esterase